MTAAQVSHEVSEERTVIRISGDLDFASVAPVTDRLEGVLAESTGALVLDLSATTFLDSAGIKLLYDLNGVMRARGAEMLIVVPAGNLIRRTLALTGAEGTLLLRASFDDVAGG